MFPLHSLRALNLSWVSWGSGFGMGIGLHYAIAAGALGTAFSGWVLSNPLQSISTKSSWPETAQSTLLRALFHWYSSVCFFQALTVALCALNMDVSLVLFCRLDTTEFSSKMESNVRRLMWEMFCCSVALGRQLICWCDAAHSLIWVVGWETWLFTGEGGRWLVMSGCSGWGGTCVLRGAGRTGVSRSGHLKGVMTGRRGKGSCEIL